MQRHSTFLWMKDLVEHLRNCTDQWQGANGRHGELVWADAMRRDLDELRRLCDGLRHDPVLAR